MLRDRICLKGDESMRQLKKAYLEITNICNLTCAFCPGTRRQAGFLSPDDFRILAEKLRPHTEYLYLHVMGEPLLHPRLAEILKCAEMLSFKVIIVTNGTLLTAKGELLCKSPAVDKVGISLHSFEGNARDGLADYLTECIRFAQAASAAGKKCALRLWNLDGRDIQGANTQNEEILTALEDIFPKPWKVGRRGTTLAPNVFLELGERFEWPDLSMPERKIPSFCYGLRDHVGVLWDGTVVPCCLDHEGDMPLGSLYEQDLEKILDGSRAKSIYEGFSRRVAQEKLCRRCGFARRF